MKPLNVWLTKKTISSMSSFFGYGASFPYYSWPAGLSVPYMYSTEIELD